MALCSFPVLLRQDHFFLLCLLQKGYIPQRFVHHRQISQPTTSLERNIKSVENIATSQHFLALLSRSASLKMNHSQALKPFIFSEDIAILIIESRDDWTAEELANFALVSPTCRDAVYGRLYRRIKLKTVDSCCLLIRSLSVRPPLAEMIKSLDLAFDGDPISPHVVMRLLQMVHLKELYLRETTCTFLDVLVRSIACSPELEELTIDGRIEEGWFAELPLFAYDLFHFLPRLLRLNILCSKVRLKCRTDVMLTAKSVPMREAEIVRESNQDVPYLRSLKLGVHCFSDTKSSLQLLFYTMPDCSRLESLTVVSQRGGLDRKSTRLNSSHSGESRMPSSA